MFSIALHQPRAAFCLIWFLVSALLTAAPAWAQQTNKSLTNPKPPTRKPDVASPKSPKPPTANRKPAATKQVLNGAWQIPEEWTRIDLVGTNLTPAPPVLVLTDDKPTYIREVIRLQWRAFDPINLHLIRPKGVAKPPVAIFLYSYPSTTSRFELDRFAQWIASLGYACAGFEIALAGDRFRMRPLREWFLSEMQEALATSTHDVQFLINYLQTRPDLDARQVGMFGQGSGGTVAILAAAADARIVAVDLLVPWGDWPKYLKSAAVLAKEKPELRGKYSTPEFLKTVAMFEPLDHLPKLKGRNVRMTFVADEPTCPNEVQDSFERVAKPLGFLVDRNARTPAFVGKVSGVALFRWLGQQLGASPAGVNSAAADVSSEAPVPVPLPKKK